MLLQELKGHDNNIRLLNVIKAEDYLRFIFDFLLYGSRFIQCNKSKNFRRNS